MNKKTNGKILLTAIFSLFGLLFIINTASASSLSGYAWSSNIGWISFNSANTGAGSGAAYSVDIATTTGNFSGYAWSSGVGWISFQDGDASHSNPTINLTTGAVTGWARVLSAIGSNSGWDGWIKLSGTNHASPDLSGKGGVTFNKDTGAFTGYAWGSDVVGWINFDANMGIDVTCPTCVTIVQNSSPTCTLSVNPSTPVPYTGGDITLTWNNTSADKTNYNNCTGSGFNTSNASNGSVVVTVPENTSTAYSLQYSLSCANDYNQVPRQCSSASLSVQANPSIADMWVDNIPTKKITKIRVGQKARINWSLGDYVSRGYTCKTRDVGSMTLPGWAGQTLTTDQSVTAFLTDSIDTSGTYDIQIKCEKHGGSPDKIIGPVKVVVSDTAIQEF